MRSLSGGETTVLASAEYRVSLRVKVANGSGTMKDMSSLSSIDWQQTVSIDNNLDDPVMQATVTFRRDAGSLSLSPLRSDSTLNRNDAAAYSPLLDVGRLITIEAATTAVGVAPSSGDWKLLFKGYIDSVEWDHDPITVVARDEGCVLVDRFIEVSNEYGVDTPLEDVMQGLLDDNLGAGVVTLYTPVSPSFALKQAYNPMRTQSSKVDDTTSSLMDALKSIAEIPGWDVRYKWDDATSQFRLTFFEPDRDKVTVDYTFGASRYLDVTQLRINRDRIRNAIRVEYGPKVPDGTARPYVNASDATSITSYGRKWLWDREATNSQIDTVDEATQLANAILSDLKDPQAEQEIELHFWWPGDVGDLYTFTANNVHYNADQTWAVVGVRHELQPNSHRTYITVRGTPAGAYRRWLNRNASDGVAYEPDVSLNNFRVTEETDSTRTYSWDAGILVTEVWAAAVDFDLPLPVDPWSSVITQTVPLSTAVNSYTVTLPAAGKETLIQIEPRLNDYSVGPVRRATIKSASGQAPVIEFAVAETDTTGTLYLKVQERGTSTVSVMLQTKLGNNTPSAFTEFARQEGDTSTIKGRTLLADEYEHDITLDVKRLSWMLPRVVMDSGEVYNVDVPPFDRNRVPDIVAAFTTGTALVCIGDSDGESWKLQNLDGTWEYSVDGSGVVVDLTKTTGNGTTGSQAPMGASSTWNIGIWYYAAPRTARTASTQVDYQTITVSGGSAPAVPYWEAVTASSPVAGSGSRTVGITLDGDAASSGKTAKLYARQKVDGVWSDYAEISSTVSPALTTAPTSATPYTYTLSDSTYNMSDPSTGNQLYGAKTIEVEVRADILSSGVVVATGNASAVWRYGGTVPLDPTPDPTWTDASASTPSVGSKTVVVSLQADYSNGTATLKRRFDDGQGYTGWVDITSSLSPSLSSPPTSLTAYTYTGLPAYLARASSGNLVTVNVEFLAEIRKNGVLTDSESFSTSWEFDELRY